MSVMFCNIWLRWSRVGVFVCMCVCEKGERLTVMGRLAAVERLREREKLSFSSRQMAKLCNEVQFHSASLLPFFSQSLTDAKNMS